jgi:membrane protease YdiL (CAAX protease family)
MNKIKIFIIKNRNNPWIFFIITFFLTWSFWIPAIFIGKDINSLSVMILIVLGGITGKILPPTILPYLTYNKQGWRDYWKRLVDFSRIGLVWWLLTLFLPVLFTLLGIFTAYLLGYALPSFEITNPLMIIPYAIFLLIYGPLPEEMGWAGFELDRLQAKYNALLSSLILGVFWALWHLPLFFIDGSYQNSDVILGSLRFWLTFIPGIISLQILQTWIYNNTGRSILTAVIIHFMVNFSGEMLALTDIHEYLRTLWTILFTIIVIFVWGYKTLTGSKNPPKFKEILQSNVKTTIKETEVN